MATRTITGPILKLDGTPYTSGVVTFRAKRPIVTASGTGTPAAVTAAIGSGGAFTTTLLVPDSGAALYEAVLPDERVCEFQASAGSATTLHALLLSGMSQPSATALSTHQATIASPTQLGHIKVGDGLDIAEDGTLSATGGGGGGGGAPTGAQYVTLATNGTLTAERVLAAGDNVAITDGGAGGNVTIAVPSMPLADVTGLQAALDAKADDADVTALDGRLDALEAAPPAHTHPQSDVTNLASDLALKAPLASPALTGTPTAPTASGGTSSTQIATTAFVAAALAALINAAPGALDTLDELAAALGDDPAFATTITNALAGKLAKSSNLSDLTDASAARGNLGLGSLATLSAITASLISDASANGRSLLTAADYAAMRTLLGLVIGTNVQAWDADLDTLAGMGSTRAALLAGLGAFAQTFLGSADAAAARGAIGVNQDVTGGILIDHMFSGIGTAISGPLLIASSLGGSGSGAGAIAPPDASAFGVANLTTGTTATGRSAANSSQTIRFGGVAQQIAYRFQFPTLLDGTDSGSVYIGWMDNGTGVPTDGAYLYWDNTQTNLRARTRSSGTQTDEDLGVAPVLSTWYILVITVNAAGTSARFDLYNTDGTSLLGTVTSTTNIPASGGRETSIGVALFKSAGTSPRSIYLDFLRYAWGTCAV